jgi:hypothetical protein
LWKKTGELMANDKREITRSIVESLDEMLQPSGYDRQNLVWRKNGDNAIIAISLSENDGILDVDFCAWLTANGPVDPLDVKRGPGGKRHLESSLSDLVPEAQGWRLQRVLHLELDYAKDPDVLHYDDYTDAEKQAILQAMEPEIPLTPEWRRSALTGIMAGHVLPLFERIESGEITDQMQLQAGESALDLVAEVRKMHEADAPDDDVIDFLFAQDVLPAIAWEIMQEGYQLKSWQRTLRIKLTERIDKKWAMRRKAKVK